MKRSALGLTCKDAMLIFSQNETLRLQQENEALRARLAKHEPIHRPVFVYESIDAYFDKREQSAAHLLAWIRGNVTACDSREFDYEHGIHAVCEAHHLHDAIAEAAFIVVPCKQYCEGLANEALSVAEAVCVAAHYTDGLINNSETWCQNQRAVQDVMDRVLNDYLFEKYTENVDWNETK